MGYRGHVRRFEFATLLMVVSVIASYGRFGYVENELAGLEANWGLAESLGL